jgi:hypothetical protein
MKTMEWMNVTKLLYTIIIRLSVNLPSEGYRNISKEQLREFRDLMYEILTYSLTAV